MFSMAVAAMRRHRIATAAALAAALIAPGAPYRGRPGGAGLGTHPPAPAATAAAGPATRH
jgi:hypothetical protein